MGLFAVLLVSCGSPSAGPEAGSVSDAGEAAAPGLTQDAGLVDGGATVCGDGLVGPGEACDDSNTVGGDYCSTDCRTVTGRCGDRMLQSNETCDDGNTLSGDCCAGDELNAVSPAIDAAQGATATVYVTGKSRAGTTPDLGAYEF